MGLLDQNYTAGDINKHVAALRKQGLSGSALDERIYSDAKSKGVTTGQLEGALGWSAGSVKQWTDKNNKAALNGGYGQAVSGYSKNTHQFTGDQIKSRVSNLSQNTNGALDHDMRIYKDALVNGVSSSELEQAMGWDAGRVSQWTNKHQLDSLDRQKASSQGASSTQAVMRNVNAETDTVQGQLNGLLKKENPLMQRAYYKGLDQANSRGLLNSSMSSEAAQAAMVDAALPIAKQDAATYFDQGKTNQAFQNQFNLNDRRFNQSQQSNQSNTDNAIRKGAYDVTANTQGAYLSAIDKITNNAAISISSIETKTNIAQVEKDKMIANTIARRDADLAWTRKLYSSMPTWNTNWFKLNAMPSAPGIT